MSTKKTTPRPKKKGLRLHNYLIDELNFNVVNRYIELYRKDEKLYYMMSSLIDNVLKGHKKRLSVVKKQRISLVKSFKDGSYIIPEKALKEHTKKVNEAKKYDEDIPPLSIDKYYKMELVKLDNLLVAVEANPLCGMDKEALSLFKSLGKDMKTVLSTLISYCYPKMQTLKIDTEETDKVIFNIDIKPK